jgi:hypothetical protein
MLFQEFLVLLKIVYAVTVLAFATVNYSVASVLSLAVTLLLLVAQQSLAFLLFGCSCY